MLRPSHNSRSTAPEIGLEPENSHFLVIMKTNRIRTHTVLPKSPVGTSIHALIVAVCLANAVPAVAQGTINFNTFIVGARVYDSDGTTPLTGTSYVSQLWVGTQGSGEGALMPVESPVRFRTGAGAGYIILSTNVVVPFITSDSPAVVQMRVWNGAMFVNYAAAAAGGGKVGKSNLILITLGSSGGPPPPKVGGADLVSMTGCKILPVMVLSFGSPRAETYSVGTNIASQSCGITVGPKISQDFTSSGAGYVVVSTRNAVVDVVLEAYAGYYLAGYDGTRTSCGDLPDDGPDARIAFPVQPTTSYIVTLAAKSGQAGVVELEYVASSAPPAVQRIEFDSLTNVYDGTNKPVRVTTTPQVRNVIITYDDLPDPPVNAGTYRVVATVDDPPWTGSATNTLVIRRAVQTIPPPVLPPRLFLTQAVTLPGVTTSAGFPASFEATPSSSVAIQGNQLTPLLVGPFSIRAVHAGTANYLPGESSWVDRVVEDPRPRLQMRLDSAAGFAVELFGPPDCKYVVEETSVLPTANWTERERSRLDPSGHARVALPVQATGARYFRARWLPDPPVP